MAQLSHGWSLQAVAGAGMGTPLGWWLTRACASRMGAVWGQTGEGVDMPNELIADLPTEELAVALAGLLPRGLPATEATAGDVLPNLRSVYARAVHPDVRLSRIDALNEL